MTTHSEITMIEKKGRGGRKASEMTSEELEAARARAAHARLYRKENAKKRRELKMLEAKPAVKEKRKYTKRQDNAKIFLDNFETYKALTTKIASLEHQAVQYRTVIDYLESKVDSLLSRK